MILKIGRDIPGRNVLAVEYDSAMHLGIAPNDPINPMMINATMNPDTFPIRWKNLL